MLMFLQAVGEAVVAKGLGALKGFVPFGNVLFDVGADAIDRYRKLRREAKLAEDVEAALRAEMKDIRADAERIIRDAAKGEPDEIIDLAVAYLTQMPGAIRQSLKRADDPTGTTLPPALNLQDPIQLSALLPRRLPTFRAGDAVPHAPQWRFVELLGAGGFGEVWLAKHAYLDDLRAIKFCLDPASRNRLLTHEKDVVRRVMQASAAASATDHGIVRLLDCYLEPDGPWLAYEYIDGGDLATWARANALLAPPLRAVNALNIVRDLAGVVGHFHALPQPVIHRDLKPANVLLKRVNGQWLLRVTDFGIGHVGAAAGIARATVSTPSMSLGDTFRGAHTPNYASPQQKRGEPADPRDDIHALGIIALQLLLGDLSAERPSGNSWKKKLKDCDLPSDVLDLLARCWEDDPDERPANARELLSSLAPLSPGGRGVGGQGESSRPKPPATPDSRQPEGLSPPAQASGLGTGVEVPSSLKGSLAGKGETLSGSEPIPADSPGRSPGLKETALRAEDKPPVKLIVPAAPKLELQPPVIPVRKAGDRLEVMLPGGVPMAFAWCPPGTFISDNKSDSSQMFTLETGYYLAVYPVTQAQWGTVFGSNPSHFRHDYQPTEMVTISRTLWERLTGQPETEMRNTGHRIVAALRPVEMVSWEDAARFCAAVQQHTGRPIRLPSEIEWEYACTAGEGHRTSLTTTELRKVAWYSEQHSHDVGQLHANNWGFCDMLGNVWEWCSDWYRAQISQPNPLSQTRGNTYRVVRGGAWNRPSAECHPFSRTGYDHSTRAYNIGFRVILMES